MSDKDRTLTTLGKELIANPFFPILFIAEFVKQLVQSGMYITEYGILSIAFIILWVLSDIFMDKELVKEQIIGTDD